MMNNIFRKVSLFTVVLSSCLMMQSCLEEELPKDYATGSQVQGSETAQQGLLTGLSAYMVKSGVYGDGSAYDNGYPSQMIIRDVMTEDFPVYNADYDYFSYIENGKGLRSPFNYTYFYYYGLVNNANSIISSLDVEGASESAKASAGVAYAYRALAYLDMARMFEFKKTGFSDFDAKAAKIMGLTVPIVTEKTTGEEGKNNPRVPYYTMYRFILHDLNKAEAYLKGYKRTGKEQPDESVVDGLKARFWLELGSRFYDSADDLTAQLAHENDADGYDALGITAVNDCLPRLPHMHRLPSTIPVASQCLRANGIIRRQVSILLILPGYGRLRWEQRSNWAAGSIPGWVRYLLNLPHSPWVVMARLTV